MEKEQQKVEKRAKNERAKADKDKLKEKKKIEKDQKRQGKADDKEKAKTEKEQKRQAKADDKEKADARKNAIKLAEVAMQEMSATALENSRQRWADDRKVKTECGLKYLSVALKTKAETNANRLKSAIKAAERSLLEMSEQALKRSRELWEARRTDGEIEGSAENVDGESEGIMINKVVEEVIDKKGNGENDGEEEKESADDMVSLNLSFIVITEQSIYTNCIIINLRDRRLIHTIFTTTPPKDFPRSNPLIT